MMSLSAGDIPRGHFIILLLQAQFGLHVCLSLDTGVSTLTNQSATIPKPDIWDLNQIKIRRTSAPTIMAPGDELDDQNASTARTVTVPGRKINLATLPINDEQESVPQSRGNLSQAQENKKVGVVVTNAKVNDVITTDVLPSRPTAFPDSKKQDFKEITDAPITALESSEEQMVKAQETDIFSNVGTPGWTLQEKIIELEHLVCHSYCYEFPSNFPPNVMSRCQRCSCAMDCALLHTCCPQVILSGQVAHEGMGSECVALVPTGLINIVESLTGVNKLMYVTTSMFTKCPARVPGDPSLAGNTPEAIGRRRCEHPDISKPDQIFPASDTTTRLTYRNVYCAQCHDVASNDTYQWESGISCKGNADLLLESHPTKERLYEMLTSVEEVNRTGCHMEYVPRQIYGLRRECRLVSLPVIETCNQTGLWPLKSYNPDIETACRMYSSLFMNKYRNLFCFVCNSDQAFTVERLSQLVRDSGQANVGRLSFSALVDFSNIHQDGDTDHKSGLHGGLEDTCEDMQFFDNLTCSCQDIGCSEGKEFISEDNTCQSVIASSLIGYRTCVQMEIQTYGPTTQSALGYFLNSWRLALGSIYKTTVTVSKWCPGSRSLTVHFNIADVQVSEFETLEEMETRIEKLRVGFCFDFSLDIHLGQIEECLVDVVGQCPDPEVSRYPCETKPFVVLNPITVTGSLLFDEKQLLKSTSFVTYRKTNRCPFIEIPIGDFHESGDNLTHLTSGQSIGRRQVDFMMNNTLIRLCLDDYKKLTQRNTSLCLEGEEEDDFDTWTPAGLVSIISSCISLLFLFFTFVTHLLFDQLRSGGGKHIMMITVVLFVAQALYEFTIEQFENRILCSFFGVAIHYFWLASIFSMNACTVERFYKLCFPLRSRSFFLSKKPFLMSTAYTFLCPLVIVGFNIIANVNLKHDFGYGGPKLCYINERYSRIFSFVLPVCVIVLLNLFLFFVTVVKLRKQSHPGDKRVSKNKIGLVACVRLSVATGMTWLVSLLYEAVPEPAMGYIFTALLGLQGVIFFFSIVVNKRVVDLYRTLFSHKLARYSSSGSSGFMSSSKKDLIQRNNKARKTYSGASNLTDLTHLASGENSMTAGDFETKEENKL